MRPHIGRCRLADPNCAARPFFVHRMHEQASNNSNLLAEWADHTSGSAGIVTFDRARLLSLVEPIVAAHHAELCDLELKNENGLVLRVLVERLGSKASKLSTKDAAVDLDLCSDIARDLSTALDDADPIPQRYQLEVGSPGVERALHTSDDFDRFLGEKAKLKLRIAVAGQKVLVGKLAALEGRVLTVEDGAQTYLVPLEDVVSARLVFEFGPTPKPGGPHRAGSKKTSKRKK